MISELATETTTALPLSTWIIDKVKHHIEQDIKRGWVVEMTKEEAERKFGDELQIASLDAVPKDQEWSDVRVVHDGTHGIYK